APVDLKPIKWVLGLGTLSSALKWEGDSKPARMVIVPRDPSKEVKIINVPARFCFHFANAFEDPNNGELVVDVVEGSYLYLAKDAEADVPVWDNIDWKKLPKNKLQRYRLDVSSKEGSLVSSSNLYEKAIEFPKVSCQEHRYVWAVCGSIESDEACPMQGVMKLDTVEGTVDKWIPEPHEFLGEVRKQI
ncbi:unnamed protein product, partial [Ectocarpus fasciculatus]